MVEWVVALVVVGVCVATFVFLVGSTPELGEEELERLREEHRRVLAERERRGRNRRHALGRGGDPNELAPWDRL